LALRRIGDSAESCELAGTNIKRKLNCGNEKATKVWERRRTEGIKVLDQAKAISGYSAGKVNKVRGH